MSCGQEHNLTRWLEGTLGAAESREMERHLESCAGCAGLAGLWRELGELPELAAPPSLRSRFARLIDAQARPARRWWTIPAAAAVLMAVFGAGYMAGHRPDARTGTLHEEVRHLRALVVLSLLEQQSAGQRLRGIGFASEQPGEREVTEALITALEHDPSVDVRLAAAGALRRGGASARVRQGFAEALARELSPLVQVVLIEALVELGGRLPVATLRRLASESGDEIVRERARAAAAGQIDVTSH